MLIGDSYQKAQIDTLKDLKLLNDGEMILLRIEDWKGSGGKGNAFHEGRVISNASSSLLRHSHNIGGHMGATHSSS